MTGSKAELSNEFEKTFDRSKRLSDFIGMIIRYGFLIAAQSFFWPYFVKNEFDYYQWAYGFCFLITAIMSVVMFANVVRIITLYLAAEDAHIGGPIFRVFVGIVSLVLALLFTFGIFNFVQALTTGRPI